MTKIASPEFRAALGGFVTGVTVVTTLTGDNVPFGMTASSFNSVSLDPPLVLWSLAKTAKSMSAFSCSGHFAVHVLAAGQESLCDHFSRSGGDKFSQLKWEKGVLGSPLFAEFSSRFECRTRHQYEGGDHIIFVGEVLEFARQNRKPLVFHEGSYAGLTTR